ncbi:MAG: Gfo/Idh/MocA family oxidoreductase [Clostridiaceae bacterium]|jgi:predicted dehydrogenase|nr:Gfo/Idh/MocA family oxidoreductase [Clostridiaceae bacterium]
MKKFNAAIIGCGAVHNVHVNAISSLNNTQLCAVADTDTAIADDAARRYDCRSYHSFSDVIADPQIDTVHICTPHHLHSSMAIEAMRAGKHVLTEKPMAITAEECREMIRVSDQSGRQLGVCFQNRYNTTSIFIKELLRSGKAGHILAAKASVTWLRKADYYLQSDWRGTWEKEGGGIMINQAIHTLDLLQWFIGNPVRIKGTIDNRMLGDVIEVEDTAEATIIFENGIHAFFYATNSYHDSPVELELVCENAVIKLSGALTIQYSNGDTENVRDVHPKTGEKAYYGVGHISLIDDFYSSLAQGRPFPTDGRQGIEAVRLVRGLYSSSRSGKWIDL